MATLTNMITRVSDDAGSNSSVSGVSARITRFINRVCQRQWMVFPWNFRWRTYRLVTNTEITDSSSSQTATATNGSRTVTFSGSVGLSSNVYTGQTGWYIVFTGDSVANFYKILSVTNSSTLVLDQPYQGTTGSSKTFRLRQLDYILPSEIADIENMIFTYDNHTLEKFDVKSMEVVEPLPLSKGAPVTYGIYSSYLNQNTYTTGTIAGTINTYTITGSGTSWLANVFPGDSVTIGSYVYKVNSVDSDTQITLYQQQVVTSSAGTTYTISNQYQRVARIIYAADQNYTLDLRYLRAYWPLVNNNDLNELTNFYEDAVSKSATALELKQKGDPRWVTAEQEAEANWQVHRAEQDGRESGRNVRSLHSPYRSKSIQRLR